MSINDVVYSNSEEEYQEICAFLNMLSTKDPYMLWESGRMNFWRYNVHADKEPHDKFFRNNVHIWRDDNQVIVGFCISEYGKNDLFIEVRPPYQVIYPQILHWIENTWGATREVIEIEVFSDNVQKIDRLKAQGFSFLYHFENKRTYDLQRIDLGYHLEAGFVIEAFSESFDYAGRVALVQSAFNNPNYRENNLKGLMSSPDYNDEYNLMVISPDKLPVAYCVGWHDRANDQHGYIEPVGTHSAYRQRGFAKAIINKCFSRLKRNGIKTVEIASRAEPDVSNYLYDSLCPQTKREVHKYAKKVSQ